MVTGFLGSGKTSLIGRLLREPAMAGTAVIVNEFGEIGLDQELLAPDLLQSGDERILALTTGCLCCAVRTDLVTTLLELQARRAEGRITYQRVLVETSGLADPAPILHALMTDPALAGSHAVGAVVTLVDSLLGEATLAAHPEARRQVALADRILLSKTDLAAPSPGLRDAIAALNTLAPVGVAAADPGLLLAPPALRAPPPDAPAHGGEVESFVLARSGPLPALALTLWLQALAEHAGERLLRMKGLVDVAEMPGRPALIHGVQHVFAEPAFLPAWPGARGTRIVFIARRQGGRGIPRHFPARLLEAIAAEVEAELAARSA